MLNQIKNIDIVSFECQVFSRFCGTSFLFFLFTQRVLSLFIVSETDCNVHFNSNFLMFVQIIDNSK